MNRKPVFDAVKTMIGGHFNDDQVKALDLACDLAEAVVAVPDPKPAPPSAPATASGPPAAPAQSPAYRLGSLCKPYESGNGGPGTVSPGNGDPGGVSYGSYQLSSSEGTLTTFLKAEGKTWTANFGTAKPGSPAFSQAWKAIAVAEPDRFEDAQHTFIERTHYRTAVAAVLAAKGLDLDSRHNAVRDATWSISVQHGKAATILIDAINACDKGGERFAPDYDRRLVKAMYQRRIAYVLGVAANPKLKPAERDQLISVTQHRYPAELADALRLFDAPAEAAPPPAAPAPAVPVTATSIDGNVVAAANGVLVKSAAVKISKLHPKMATAIVTVATVAKAMGLPTPAITSGNDSTHMDGSLHYQWRALDFRGNNIQVTVGQAFAAKVSAALGGEYDVAFETFVNTSNNHLHVEYDPS